MKSFIKKIIYLINADRIGPDIITTHWMLHIPFLMKWLCLKKLKKFGLSSEIRPGAYLDTCSKISIGEKVVIRPGTFLYADSEKNGAGITIENKVLIGPNVQFYTNNHKFESVNIPIFDQGYPKPEKKNEIICKEGCWVGAGSILLPGVKIGKNSIVGAGSVVTRSVPPRTLVAGNPAKIIKHFSKKKNKWERKI